MQSLDKKINRINLPLTRIKLSSNTAVTMGGIVLITLTFKRLFVPSLSALLFN